MNTLAHKRPAVQAFVGLGGNIGPVPAVMQQALQALQAEPGIALLAVSGLWRSAPIDSSGPDYFNAVAQVSSCLTAPGLLNRLQRQERLAGRRRPWRNAPRTLDLDLILYGKARIWSPGLQLPHPRWRQRAFVLLPLAELAPELVSAQDLQAVAGQDCVRVQDHFFPLRSIFTYTRA